MRNQPMREMAILSGLIVLVLNLLSAAENLNFIALGLGLILAGALWPGRPGRHREDEDAAQRQPAARDD